MENKRQYYISLTMLGCLFFVFGLVSWVNSILIPYFKIACELKSGVQTYLVTFAFYIAYLVMTVPASFLLRRTGYKKGTMIGLWTMAIGALLFWPAALTRTYGMFLLALFTIGTALAILQSVANPFVTIIGPYESAAKRISVMGICNKFAGIIAPLVFAALVIRPQDKEVMDLVEAGLLDGPAKEAALDSMIRGVIVPYVVLAALLFAFGILFYKSPVQDINPDSANGSGTTGDDRKSIWEYPYLVLGVLALFCHLGSQQISVSTIIGYAQSIGIGSGNGKGVPVLHPRMHSFRLPSRRVLHPQIHQPAEITRHLHDHRPCTLGTCPYPATEGINLDSRSSRSAEFIDLRRNMAACHQRSWPLDQPRLVTSGDGPMRECRAASHLRLCV